MKKKLPDLITIDSSLAVPIYKQIVQSIFKGIDDGLLLQNDKLPSVNSIAERFELARGSVFTAYNELRASGIIDSIPGKGYFITSVQTRFKQNIFLLLDKFTSYREGLYNSIVKNLPAGCRVDVYFHHNKKVLFENLIREEAAYYNSFIIMPLIGDDALSALSVLDPKQVILLDSGFKEFRKHYPGIFQNFDKDIFSLLTNHKHLVSRYKRLFLVISREFPAKEIVSGFTRFGKTYVLPTAVIHDVDVTTTRRGDAFVIIDDDHLIRLIQCAKSAKLIPGKDIGILSYNETNLKSVISDGVSTITGDYTSMGKSVADMLMSNDRRVIENPFVLIDRNSF